MSQITYSYSESSDSSELSSAAPDTASYQSLSPINHNFLPLACLIPSNRSARTAIDNTFREGSVYHSNFISHVNYRGCANTPCFELALGGLPEHSDLGWRIGRGSEDLENHGVDLLLATDDDSIARVHARFGWTVHQPNLLLIILNDQNKLCTINGRDFGKGCQCIPPENTILIGDCAFTLLFTHRKQAEEAYFQIELRNHVLRLQELRRKGDEQANKRAERKDSLKRHRKDLDADDDDDDDDDDNDDRRPKKSQDNRTTYTLPALGYS
tara:strand:+ start:2034 stop:2840 length:807 start_codon:yes stop_codon:yes gene_type:complete